MSATVRCPDHRPIIAGLAVAILIAATTFATDPAQAQAFRGRGPWCTTYFDGSSSSQVRRRNDPRVRSGSKPAPSSAARRAAFASCGHVVM